MEAVPINKKIITSENETIKPKRWGIAWWKRAVRDRRPFGRDDPIFTNIFI